MKYEKRGSARIFAALANSLAGIAAAWRREEAFRTDVALCAAGALAYFILPPVGRAETALYSFAFLFLIFAELANTAIETIIDRIVPERHELSKTAKDIGSALVMLALFNLCATISFIYL